MPRASQGAIPRRMSSKPVEQLSQVIVRFCGDSGDGMQLTGSQFTSESAILGNDISTLPDFPAEIRAPAGSLPGVSGFQLHFADHDILTPGDAPNVLVAMNPAALKTNIGDLPKGGTLIVDADAFTDRNLQKAGYAQSPLEDGSLDEYQLHAIPLTSLTVGALKEVAGVTPREAERSKNMFSLGLMSWLYGRSIEPTVQFLEEKFAAKRPEIYEANVKALQAGYAFGETTETFAVHVRDQAGEAQAGHVPQHHRQPGALARPRRRVEALGAAALPRRLSDHARERDPRGARRLQGVRRPHVPGGGRDRGCGRRGRRELRRRARHHDLRRPGRRPQGGDGRPRDHARAAARDLRHPARRPVDGMPTKPEQGDLLMVLYGRNGESPVPVVAASSPSGLLRRRDRGVPDRAQVPHAGLSPLRRVPRERLRAVAPARARHAARPHADVRDRAERRRRVPPVPPRPRDARAAVGGAGHAGPRAPHRRDREGRPHGEHLVRPRQPRPHDAHARAEGRGHRGRHPRARGRRPRRRRDGARARLGRDVRADRGRRPPRARRRPARSRTRICATSTRSRATRARSCAATRRC